MLFAAPPGSNAPPMNRQNIASMAIPGQIPGISSQVPKLDHYKYSSSYSAPSNYTNPSSVNMPNPYYNMPAHSMVRALRGR